MPDEPDTLPPPPDAPILGAGKGGGVPSTPLAWLAVLVVLALLLVGGFYGFGRLAGGPPGATADTPTATPTGSATATSTPTPTPTPSPTPVGPKPVVTELRSVLKAPLTTYSAVAHDATDPNAVLTYVWKMSGENCGLPRTPWTQNGATSSWSHSSDIPDLCQHTGTDHAVTVSVTVTAPGGGSTTCLMQGTETILILNPDCGGGPPR